MLEYRYTTYDFHWPDDQHARIDAMVADGWQMFTALPNTQELSVVWQRELPAASSTLPGPGKAAQEKISGSVRDHEGQGAR